MSLETKAMTVNLRIGFWQGHRHDRAATAEVNQRNGAASDASRVNKHIIPKEVLDPISSAASAARNHFYAKTLPWRDNGDRLLPRALFTDFVAEHESLNETFKHEVDSFLTDKYISAYDQASFRMGDLFDPDDYPPPSQLRHKFYMELDFDIITSAADFRVALGREHEDRVRASMEQAADMRLKGAMREVWQRMFDKVSYLAERMANSDAKFRKSTLENIEELVDVLPGINLVDDPDIERIRKDIKVTLTGLDPRMIREDITLRAQVAEDAQKILADMGGFMKAFGGEKP